MLEYDDVPKPKCFRPRNYDDCEFRLKRNGHSIKEKCKTCEFRYRHQYLMKHDEDYL